MGTGIYAKYVSEVETGIGEIGSIHSRAKMERAARRNRQVSEREVHKKNRSYRKNRNYMLDDYDECEEFREFN